MAETNNSARISQVAWAEMAVNWNGLLDETRVEIEDGLTHDNFLSGDEFNHVVLRFLVHVLARGQTSTSFRLLPARRERQQLADFVLPDQGTGSLDRAEENAAVRLL